MPVIGCIMISWRSSYGSCERSSRKPGESHAVRTLDTSAVTLSAATTTPSASWCFGDAGSLLTYEVSGDGFLRHMVRAIVGTLVEVGRGWRDPAQMDALLQARDRARAGATAPPHGLFLVRVDYD